MSSWSSDITKTLAALLCGERRKAGVRQSDLAAHLGLHRPAISEIEKGHRRLTVGEFVQWCDLLALDHTALINTAREIVNAEPGPHHAGGSATVPPASSEG